MRTHRYVHNESYLQYLPNLKELGIPQMRKCEILRLGDEYIFHSSHIVKTLSLGKNYGYN